MAHGSLQKFLSVILLLVTGILPFQTPNQFRTISNSIQYLPPSPPTPTPLPDYLRQAREHYRKAFAFFENEQYELAAEEFWASIQYDPDYVFSYRFLAQSYIDMKKPDEGLRRFEELLEADPNNAKAYYGIGKITNEREDANPQKALEYFQKALDLDPNFAFAYYAMGVTYKNLGNKQKAYEMYQKTQEVEPGFILTQPDVPEDLLGDYQSWDELLEISQKALAEDPNGEYADEWQYNIISSYFGLGKYQEVITESEKLISQHPNSPTVVYALSAVHLASFHMGELERSLEYALRLQQEYPSSPVAVGIRVTAYHLFIKFEQYTEAEAQLRILVEDFPYWESSWRLTEENRGLDHDRETQLQAVRDGSVRADKLSEESDQLFARGDWDQSIDKIREAVTVAQEAKNEPYEAEMRTRLAKRLLETGSYQDALLEYNRSLLIFEKYQDISGLIIAYGGIGSVYQAIEDYSNALIAAQKMLEMTEAKSDDTEIGRAYEEIAANYYYLEDYEKALDHHLKALNYLELAVNPDDRMYIANVYNNIGMTYQKLNQYDKAIEYYKLAIQLYEREDQTVFFDSDLIVRSYQNIAQAYNDKGDNDAVLESFEDAIAAADRYRNLPLLASTQKQVGDHYLDIEENFSKALEYYTGALAIYQKLSDINGQATIWERIMITQFSKEDDTECLKSIDKLLETLEQLQDVATVEDVQSAYLNTLSDLYNSAINVLSYFILSSENNPSRQALLQKVFAASEEARARAFLDLIENRQILDQSIADAQMAETEQQLRLEIQALYAQRIKVYSEPSDHSNDHRLNDLANQLVSKRAEYAELLNRIKAANPQYFSVVTAETLSLPEVQSLLDDNTTLLEFYEASRRVYVFVVTKNNIDMAEVKITAEELEATIPDFSNLSELESTPEEMVKLYDLFFSLIKEKLKTENLIIVPHRKLHFLPFQALTDGQRFLIEDYNITYLPSASLLKYVKDKRGTASKLLLALGNPDVEGVPVLRHSAQEVTSISAILKSQPVIGQDATETEIKNSAEDYRIIHLSAHGEYKPNNLLYSAVLLSPDEQNDGRLETHEVYGLDLSGSDVVVLSACETSRGEPTEGDEIISLNRAFLFAGAPTIITSLWRVEEESTALLMDEFYKNLQGGMTKGNALRQAQLAIKEEYPHPYYWAGFVLNGDYGKVAPLVQEATPTPPATSTPRIPTEEPRAAITASATPNSLTPIPVGKNDGTICASFFIVTAFTFLIIAWYVTKKYFV